MAAAVDSDQEVDPQSAAILSTMTQENINACMWAVIGFFPGRIPPLPGPSASSDPEAPVPLQPKEPLLAPPHADAASPEQPLREEHAGSEAACSEPPPVLPKDSAASAARTDGSPSSPPGATAVPGDNDKAPNVYATKLNIMSQTGRFHKNNDCSGLRIATSPIISASRPQLELQGLGKCKLCW
jgi:hypothetical protein